MDRVNLAEKIIFIYREMNRLGLNQGTSGNISCRFNNGMLITPSGVPCDVLTPEQIVFVDNNGYSEEGKKPSSEWHFHLACYEVRRELNAVIHNHALYSTAISILNKDIPAIHYMVAVSGRDSIPCLPYATFGSLELSAIVAKGIQLSKAILLQHHGVVCMEETLDKALWLANEVEVLAKQYAILLNITNNVPTLSHKEMLVVLDKFKSYGLKC
ncbi:L-fuculose-phosphate aldolase [Testudinibacter aquarius]|uniref:L-fuculose 1-phosphate aldolase n=1 Tax=Testudinibacter aquarius TaxID=1524974 RepID=A0A4R3YA65_9PAST|nr:L-fuculose-phosphate aldolase [Testudinibacter aquarius]KAE9528336.1 L-fuculose phosphate aldolase [Testudinibacter aquarius]TCV88826.1 L-fuculose 1-phosphate aldolase [Testudinibacter aquarius]TNG88495.1 L-fuculose-phosphate aldolase [Testudinibacter aquarius]